jgi:hypothetical protein
MLKNDEFAARLASARNAGVDAGRKPAGNHDKLFAQPFRVIRLVSAWLAAHYRNANSTDAPGAHRCRAPCVSSSANHSFR